MDTGTNAAAPGLALERAHVKPEDIHSYGLNLLKKNGFQLGQSIDITYTKGQKRIFALDVSRQYFYFDPAPAGIPNARLIFGVYRVDRITGASIYEREKISDVQSKKNTGVQNIKSTGVLRQRSLGVQVLMDDAAMPALHIQCLPYAAVGNSEYISRLALAQRVLQLLADAIGPLKAE